MVSIADIKGNVNHKPHCKRIQAPNVYVNKKKGTEKDPTKGFLFPVKSIEEKHGESTHIPRDTSDSGSESSSSSSDSSDEESSGSRGKPLAADKSESAEDIRAKRLEKDFLDEDEDTEDFWVVTTDRVLRMHVTPRHHLFDPDQCSPPIPLEYLDVIRFTETNVKGSSQVVDCWVTDPRADQVKGPWVGKTSFNIRLPPPKKGWVIQNGRPTKVEENTSRPEYIWVEEWRNLSKRKSSNPLLLTGKI